MARIGANWSLGARIRAKNSPAGVAHQSESRYGTPSRLDAPLLVRLGNSPETRNYEKLGGFEYNMLFNQRSRKCRSASEGGPHLVNIEPALAQFGRFRADAGRNWPTLRKLWSERCQLWPNSRYLLSSLGKVGRSWPVSGRIRPKIQPSFRVCPEFGKKRPAFK